MQSFLLGSSEYFNDSAIAKPSKQGRLKLIPDAPK